MDASAAVTAGAPTAPFVVDSATGPMIRFPQRREVTITAFLRRDPGLYAWDAVADPFDIDVHEVSVADYAACVRAGACSHTRVAEGCNEGNPQRQDHPINCVIAAQAAAYCVWAKKRLPTYDEWENAAKYPERNKYPVEESRAVANSREHPDDVCWDRKLAQGTCAVGTHPVTRAPSGLDDLFGNVREWTATDLSEWGPTLTGWQAHSRFVCGGAFAPAPYEDTRYALTKYPEGTDSVTIFGCDGVDETDAWTGNGMRCARSVP